MPFAKHLAEPNWIPGDWYLEQAIPYRAAFNLLVRPLFALFDLSMVAILGRFLCFCLFSLGVQQIARALDLRARFMTIFVLLYLAFPSLGSGEWIIGGVEAKSFSYGLLFLGIAQLLNGSFSRSAALLGLSSTFHVLVGGFASLAVLSSALATRLKGISVRVLAKSALIFCIFALPAFYAVFTSLRAGGSDSLVYVNYRVPHHLIPTFFHSGYGLRCLAYSLFLTLAAIIGRRSKNTLFLASLGLTSLIPAAIGFLIFKFGPIPLLKFYWFRLADVLLPFLSWLLLLTFLDHGLKTAPRLKTESRTFLNGAVLAVSAVLVLHSGMKLLQSASARLRYSGDFAETEVDPNFLPTVRWIKQNTAPDGVFLVDPRFALFYWLAERPVFVSFKHSPQSEAEFTEWFERIKFTNGGSTPEKNGFASLQELSTGFQRLSAAQLREGNEKYGVRYYLVRNRELSEFKKLHSDAEYSIYDLRSAP